MDHFLSKTVICLIQLLKFDDMLYLVTYLEIKHGWTNYLGSLKWTYYRVTDPSQETLEQSDGRWLALFPVRNLLSTLGVMRTGE